MDAARATIPITAPRFSARRLIGTIGLALALGYTVLLGTLYAQGYFLRDAHGRIIDNDFVNVYAAGELTLEGLPAGAYNWPVHKRVEVRVIGHPFLSYYGWHYPPTFLFVAMELATVPYLVALLGWLGITLAGFAATMRLVIGDRIGMLFALGFPATIWNITAGQNGFFTAALIGGTLGFLEKRPALAGVFLGLLTYKPQFGLLFPLVLIADRRWLTIGVAALTAVTLAGLSWLAFGSESWQAFAHWMPITSRIVLGEGGADWNRLQSVFGLIRAHGGGETLAWSLQIAASLAVAAWVFWLWRSKAAFELKAAALAAGTLLVTPYVYMYDVVALAVAAGFLLRYALVRGFLISEIAGLAAGGVLILIFPFVRTQTGLAAIIIVMLMIVQRAHAELRVSLRGLLR
jgi:hypothetical protein